MPSVNSIEQVSTVIVALLYILQGLHHPSPHQFCTLLFSSTWQNQLWKTQLITGTLSACDTRYSNIEDTETRFKLTGFRMYSHDQLDNQCLYTIHKASLHISHIHQWSENPRSELIEQHFTVKIILAVFVSITIQWDIFLPLVYIIYYCYLQQAPDMALFIFPSFTALIIEIVSYLLENVRTIILSLLLVYFIHNAQRFILTIMIVHV